MISAPACVPQTMKASGTATSILLVEDDASLRRSLAEFLKESGYHPYSAGTMREAWETLRAVSPSVCLLDLNLPDGSGLDLLRGIVAESLPVRVIVMTAFPLKHLQPQFSERILVGWLTKPVAPGTLLEAVEAAMKVDENE
jgi:DNA-binding response OmpR family regulator